MRAAFLAAVLSTLVARAAGAVEPLSFEVLGEGSLAAGEPAAVEAAVADGFGRAMAACLQALVPGGELSPPPVPEALLKTADRYVVSYRWTGPPSIQGDRLYAPLEVRVAAEAIGISLRGGPAPEGPTEEIAVVLTGRIGYADLSRVQAALGRLAGVSDVRTESLSEGEARLRVAIAGGASALMERLSAAPVAGFRLWPRRDGDGLRVTATPAVAP